MTVWNKPVYSAPFLSQGLRICFEIPRRYNSWSGDGAHPCTFFFAHGELTVTLEDIENHWLLPILGDQDPADFELSLEELRIEAALVDYVSLKVLIPINWLINPRIFM